MAGDVRISRRMCVAGIAATAMGARALAEAAPAMPQAGRVRRLDPALDRLIAPDAAIERVASGFDWAEGPVWVPSGGQLLFSDVPANRMYRWSENRGQGLFLEPSGRTGGPDPAVREGGSNGLALDREGRLIIADSGTRAIARLDLRTMTREVLADRWEGKRFNSPNDVVLARDGAIYFTDPTYGLTGGDKSPLRELTHNGVYRRGADGTLSLIDAALSMPNGIGLSPAEDRLYVSVSDPAAPRIMVYDLDRAGHATNGRLFFDAMPLLGAGVQGLPDGMTVDSAGNLFAGGPGGLLVISPEARLLGVVEVAGRPVSNCCFGAKKWLYMTADDSIVRVRARAHA